MNKIVQYFFRRRNVFFQLFNQIAQNITVMATTLEELLHTELSDNREEVFKKISTLEHIGDDLTHKIYLELDQVFYPPFDRKDVHLLASALDDLADYINEASERMNLYGIDEISPAMQQMATLTLNSCTELQKAIAELPNLKKQTVIKSYCEKIKEFEYQTDQIYYGAVAQLFENEKDAITLIKNKDMLTSIEAAANMAEDVAEVIETILINNVRL
jgi:predicted phosphate transport protein (TIGR00153 family)